MEGAAAADERHRRPAVQTDDAIRRSYFVARADRCRAPAASCAAAARARPRRLERAPAARHARLDQRGERPDVLLLVARDERGAVRRTLHLVRREADDERAAEAREHHVDEAARHPAVAVGERVEREEVVAGPRRLRHVAQVGARADGAQAGDQLLEALLHLRHRRGEARVAGAHGLGAQHAAAVDEGGVRRAHVEGRRLGAVDRPPEHHLLHGLDARGALRRRVGGGHAAGAVAREVVGAEHAELRRRERVGHRLVRLLELRLVEAHLVPRERRGRLLGVGRCRLQRRRRGGASSNGLGGDRRAAPRRRRRGGRLRARARGRGPARATAPTAGATACRCAASAAELPPELRVLRWRLGAASGADAERCPRLRRDALACVGARSPLRCADVHSRELAVVSRCKGSAVA